MEVTPLAIKRMADDCMKDAFNLQKEADDNHEVAKHLEKAARFLEVATELEMAGIEHTDAMMITLLLSLRDKVW